MANTDNVSHLSKENVKQREKTQQLSKRLNKFVSKNSQQHHDDIMIEEQKNLIVDLQSQIQCLRQKLKVTRQQFGSYTKICSPYMASSKMKYDITSKNYQYIRDPIVSKQNNDMRKQMEQLLREATTENESLNEQLKNLNEKFLYTKEEFDYALENMRNSQVMHDDEMTNIQNQLKTEREHLNQLKLADNIQRIKLERESRKVYSLLEILETECRALEEKLNVANENVEQLELQLTEARNDIVEEQKKSWYLQSELEESLSRYKMLDMQAIEATCECLENENRILKENNESLLTKVLTNADNCKSVASENIFLRAQMSKLENHLKIELESKAELHSLLATEKEKTAFQGNAIQKLNIRCDTLEKALSNERCKSKKVEETKRECCESCIKLVEDYGQNQWQLIKVREELSHTKSLLVTQLSISKDHQLEIDTLNSKVNKSEQFQSDLLQEVFKNWQTNAKQVVALETTMESIKKIQCLSSTNTSTK